jgi:hypothetical protein
MKTVKNLTPHPIHVVDENAKIVKTFATDGLVRLKASTVMTGLEIDGVPITKTEFGEPVGLPEFQDGVFLIVSQLVKSALRDRTDLVVPAEVVRDTTGNIIGCRSFGI